RHPADSARHRRGGDRTPCQHQPAGGAFRPQPGARDRAGQAALRAERRGNQGCDFQRGGTAQYRLLLLRLLRVPQRHHLLIGAGDNFCLHVVHNVTFITMERSGPAWRGRAMPGQEWIGGAVRADGSAFRDAWHGSCLTLVGCVAGTRRRYQGRAMFLLTPGDFRTRSSETMFFSKYAALLHILVRVGDVVVVVLTACLAHWARFGSSLLDGPNPVAVFRVVLLMLLVFPMFGLYRSWRGESITSEIGRIALAWTVVMTTLLISEWAVKNSGEYSRLWLGSWFAAALALLGVHRWVGRRLLGSIRARGIDARKVVLVGATHAGRKIMAAARQSPWMGLDVIGYVQTPYDDQQAGTDVPRVGDFDSFIANLQHYAPDQIWVALPMRAEAEIKCLLDATSELPVTIRLVPDLFGYELLNHQATQLAGVPVITLRGTRVEGHARIAK